MNSVARPSYSLEQVMRILDLAVDYLSVDSEAKEKLGTVLQKQLEDGGEISISEVFVRENLVSESEIEQLKLFDAHLRTLFLDQQFGRIAVANQMATLDDITQALNDQKENFNKYRINTKIGDILVENKVISRSDRAAVLLTQNRIREEHLAETLNEIGRTAAENEMVNKRFGVLAIRKGLVGIDQVNQALEIQRKDRQSKQKPQFIGQILKQTADLPEKEIQEILQEQKYLEKRRLDLEKSLYNLKDQIKIAKKVNKVFEYRISKDGVEAFVKKLGDADQISTYEFFIWLKQIGITLGIVSDRVLQEFIENGEKKSEILVARGVPCEPGVDETIHFYFVNDLAPVQPLPDKGAQKDDAQDAPTEHLGEYDGSEESDLKSDKLEDDADKSDTSDEKEVQSSKKKDDETDKAEPEPTDESDEDNKKGEKNEKALSADEDVCENENEYSKMSQPPKFQDNMVHRGELIARIFPGKQGKTGKDVFGRPIKPYNAVQCRITAGSGVVKKETSFYAATSGQPKIKNNTKLIVEPIKDEKTVQTIRSNINDDTRDRYELDAVELNGSITPEGVIRCRSLVLNGSLKGWVVCSGDLELKGEVGIADKPKEKNTPFLTDVICQGTVKASKSIVNTKIQTADQLIAFNSVLKGVEVIAGNGIQVKDVLNGEHLPCVLQIGLKPGDSLIGICNTLEKKTVDLSVLKQVDQINEMTREFEQKYKAEEQHAAEQGVIQNLVSIIQAPELYQHEKLEDKIKYLERLPKHSSVKAYYLKPPKTDIAKDFFDKMLKTSRKMTLEDFLAQIKNKIDPPPENEEEISALEHLKVEYHARVAAVEKEVEENSEAIDQLQAEIDKLNKLKEKICTSFLNSIAASGAQIIIKNKCEKGTVIKGKIAQYIVEKDIYKVRFSEVIDPKRKTATFRIDEY